MYSKMFKSLPLFLAFFVITHTALAQEYKSVFPLDVDMPTYDVKIIPSPTLPQPKLQLTNKALRVLPTYFKHNNVVPVYDAKIPSSLNRIRLEQLEGKAYCNEANDKCWPKSIEAVAGYLIVTSHDLETIYYKDTQKLGTFLWTEAREPIGNLMKENK